MARVIYGNCIMVNETEPDENLIFICLETLLQMQRNSVLVTNSDFLIPISFQPNFADHRYFKL